MKYSIFSLLILAIFAFTSCEKGDLEKDNSEKDLLTKEDGKDDKDGEKAICFDLVYPVTCIIPDGSVITVNDKEDWETIKAWYEANPNWEEMPELQYPVDVDWGEYGIFTVSNEEEMTEHKKKCDDGKEDKACIFLIYPVTYILPDGTEVTGDEKEVWTAIKTWYEANPDSEEKPELQYPVEVKNWKGEVIAFNNEEEMIEAKKSCEEDENGEG